MNQSIAHVALLVDDYDKAIAFYCGKLNFTFRRRHLLGNDKRWVLVKPPAQRALRCCWPRAANEQQRETVGNQSGGRVFLFLYTDHFQSDYQHLLDQGHNHRTPSGAGNLWVPFVFSDLYGNLWDLIEPTSTR